MNDPLLIAAIVADRRLTHYQVTVLWAVVARLGGEASGRFSHGDLADDLRVDRKTICRALSTLPPGTPVRVGEERGVTLFVVPSRLPAEEPDAEPAPEVEMTYTSEVHAPVPDSPHALRQRDSVVQVVDRPVGRPVPHRYRLEPPPVPDSPHALRQRDSVVQSTAVHTPALSAIKGGRGDSGLKSPGNLLRSSDVHSDAGERARGQNGNGTSGIFCADGSEDTELRLRAQKAAIKDPFAAGLEYGPTSAWPEVVELAKAFQQLWGREVRLTPSSPGVRRVVDRLAEGYTVEELLRALQGSKNDPFFQGNAHFQNLQTILRDSGQVDRFMAIAEEPPTRGITGKAIQPNHASVDPLKNAVIVEG